MKPKAELMARLRKDRSNHAKQNGLVKLRIETYVKPDDKIRILKYVDKITALYA